MGAPADCLLFRFNFLRSKAFGRISSEWQSASDGCYCERIAPCIDVLVFLFLILICYKISSPEAFLWVDAETANAEEIGIIVSSIQFFSINKYLGK